MSMSVVKALVIIAASVAIMPNVEAFDPSTGRAYIFNTTSCGQYNQDRKMPGSSSADKMFVAGWLTAYNSLVAGGDIEGDSRLDDVLLWLDHYCLDHPFETIQTGLMDFSRTVAPSLSRSKRPN